MLSVIFSFFFAGAQKQKVVSKAFFTVSGEVINKETRESIEFAVVGLYKLKDSSLVNGTVTDAKGKFALQSDSGKYYLKISYVGNETKFISPVIVDKPVVSLGVIALKPDATLKEVEIIDERPAYQVLEDKKVYRVDKDPVSATGSTADVLQNIPSVFVDLDGNVKLRGGNVRILIDGRPSGLLGISRKEILDFIPANMIESIEVINNPSSNYDANGEAGIINIILKRPKLSGISGFLMGSVGTEDKYNAAANLSFHSPKFAFYLYDDLRSYDMLGTTIRYRQTNQNNTVTYTNQNQDWSQHNLTNSIRGRAQYAIDSKNEISGSILYKKTDGHNGSLTNYEKLDSAFSPTQYYDRHSPDTTNDHSTDYTFNYTRKFNRKDQELIADFIYSNGIENTTTDITQYYYNAEHIPFTAPPLKEYVVELNNQERRMGQIDYVQPLTKDSRLETGVKNIYRSSDMDYNFLKYDYGVSDYFSVPGFTNHFIQSEQINAAYLSYRNKYKRFTYKGGIRVEQTIINSEQATLGTSSKRNYTDFFPSFHLLQKLDKSNHLNLSYSRRINRPGLRLLNPFLKYIDAITIRTGNPNLQPEYSHSLDLSHTKYWKNTTLNSSVYYRYTTGTVQKISYLIPTGAAVTTYANFLDDRDLGIEVYFSGQVSSWYRFNVGFNGYRTIIDGTNIDDTFKSDSYNFNGKLNNFFTLGKNWMIQWTGNYRAPIETPLNKIHEVYFSDLSIKKDFLRNKLTASLRVSDLFHTRNQIVDTYNPVYTGYSETERHSRILYLSITWRPRNINFRDKNLPPESDTDSENTETDDL